MNTMEALGAGPALSPSGKTPGLNLGADAETLALFASLFAMMQNPQPDGAEAAASSPVTQSQPNVTDSTQLLPAAAMLMASLAPSVEVADPDMAVSRDVVGDDASGDMVPGDAAGLLKLLLAANDIVAPDHQPAAPAPTLVADSDAGTVPAAPSRTATEMLTGAIEILKSLGTVPAEKIPVLADDALPKGPASIVIAPPSNDFIGPMPAVAAPAEEVPAVADDDLPKGPAPIVIAPPSNDFIGPMPAVMPSAALPATALKLQAEQDFIGPMPAVRSAAAVSNGAPNSVTPSLNAAPETGWHGRVDQVVKHELPKAMMDQADDSRDDGSVHRRADIQAVEKGMTERAASQNKPTDIYGFRQQMTQARSDAVQNAAPSNSAAMQGLFQQLASSSNGGNPLSAVNGQDNGQNFAANATASTAGGQSGNNAGGHAGGHSGGQQAAQQMVDGGLARGAADRTILHRLNTDNAGWSETMVKRLTADLRSGVQNVRIILEPRQLGRLNVELGLRNGKASIRIATETQEAARLLSGARVHLGQMFESAGMRLASFQATGSHAGDTGPDTGQGSQNRGGEGAGDNAGRNNTGRTQDFPNKMSTKLEDHNDDRAAGNNALREGETAVLSILA